MRCYTVRALYTDTGTWAAGGRWGKHSPRLTPGTCTPAQTHHTALGGLRFAYEAGVLQENQPDDQKAQDIDKVWIRRSRRPNVLELDKD